MSNRLNCPFCHKELQVDSDSNQEWKDYLCIKRHHLFGQRVLNADGSILVIKIRFGQPNESPMYVKFNFDKENTQIWTDKVDGGASKRITIEGAIMPDLTNLEKLNLKVKTWLLFS